MTSLYPISAIVLTPEEETIFRTEYEKYCAQYHRWHGNTGEPVSFDYWWRSQADNAKDNREGK